MTGMTRNRKLGLALVATLAFLGLGGLALVAAASVAVAGY